MPMVPTSTTYSAKFTGNAQNKTFNKTISGLDADFVSDPDNVNGLNNQIFGILDGGTAVTFNIVTNKKYAAVSS
ncbi:hypothetical protein IJ096_01565 [Candidatus Saccharibacteria bacterium]|nr:hypothetical protein [Candidatus Saccharibacteria bacterium]